MEKESKLSQMMTLYRWKTKKNHLLKEVLGTKIIFLGIKLGNKSIDSTQTITTSYKT